jgi:hypothetical protein
MTDYEGWREAALERGDPRDDHKFEGGGGELGTRCLECGEVEGHPLHRPGSYSVFGFQGLTAEQEAEYGQLREEIDTAERDAISDMGDELVEAGGYWDIVQSVVSMSSASTAAKREVCRVLGVSMPRF